MIALRPMWAPKKWVDKRRNSDSLGTSRVQGGSRGITRVSGPQRVHLLYPFVSPAHPGSQEGRREWEALTSCGMMALSAEKRGLLTCLGWGTLWPTHTLVCGARWGLGTGDGLGEEPGSLRDSLAQWLDCFHLTYHLPAV